MHRINGGSTLNRLAQHSHWFPLLVLIVSLVATVALWRAVDTRITERARNHYRQQTDEIAARIIARLADTNEVLRGGSALFKVRGDALSGREWRDYVAGLDLAANLPWVLGFGYSSWLTPAQREATIRDIRAEGLTADTIRPAGERPPSTPVIWLEPFTEVNRRAIGYDMYADPDRRAAMDRARDTGLTSVVAPIILAQDIERSRQSGMVMYIPCYRRELPTATVEQRRAALRGFVYSPIRMNDFVSAIFEGKLPTEVDFDLSAGPAPSRLDLLFSGSALAKRILPEGYRPTFSSTKTVDAYGVTWHFSFRTLPDFDQHFSYARSWLILAGGIPMSLLMGIVAYQQARSRRQAWLWAEQMAERIAERKRAEFDLRMTRVSVDAASDSIHRLTADGRIVDVNPAMCRVLGYTREELLRMTVADIDPHIGSEAFQTLFSEAREGGSLCFDSEHRTKDGRTFPVEVSLNYVCYEGEERTCAIARDISERKRNEYELEQSRQAAEAATQAKSAFLANMSHEIRTPLNGVLGLAQLLEKEPLSPDQQVMAQQIRASGRILLSIINDILDVAKIEAGQLQIERRPFTLPQLLNQLESLLGATARGKGLELRIEAPAGVTGGLLGDDLRVEQVLINLVGNAIKFTEGGTVRVTVIPLELTETAARLRFEVHDTGVGIAPEALAKLFTPFTQADGSITRRFGGTGLGLSICKRLVELMGGTIGVESRLGTGSVFRFELPFERTTDVAREPCAAAQDAATAGPRLRGRRFLVVDDSNINRLVVKRALMKEGSDVVLAEDGKQALDILRERPGEFDAVLMDVQMPVMDGLTATSLLRSDLGLSNLPVVAFTAGVLPDEKRNGLDAGVNDFLPKPVELEEMVALLLCSTAPRHIDLPPLQREGRGVGDGSTASTSLSTRPLTVRPLSTVPERPALSEVEGSREGVERGDIPAITGIDMTWVADNFGNNRQFFLEMLAMFLARFGGTAELIRADLAVGNRDAAARHLHALRGVAGNLGAQELMRTAGELEQAFVAGSSDTGFHLERVAVQLAVLREAAAPWLPEPGESPVNRLVTDCAAI